MIESALYFALGFLIAGLAALMAVPSICRRAVRLTQRRMEASTPLSLAEIKANKDQMRAEFARETRRLELAVGELRRRAAERQIEASRSNDRIAVISGERDVMSARLAALEEELSSRRDEFDSGRLNAEEARRAAEAQYSEMMDLKLRVADLVSEIDSRKIEAATLRTTIEGLDARAAALVDERKQAIYRAELADAEIGRRDLQIADERERIRRLDAALVERARDIAGKTDELRVAADRLAKAEARIATLDGELLAARERLEAAEIRAAAGPGDNLARTVEGLERSNAELESRLARLMAERDALAVDLERSRAAAVPAGSEGHRVLRERLADLAARVVQIANAQEPGASPPAASPANGVEPPPPAPPPPPAAPPPPQRPAPEADDDVTMLVLPSKPRSLTERIRSLQPTKDSGEAPPAG